MRLSFDDEESLKEALHFNPPSDPDSLELVESSSSMLPQERNESRPELEDICYDNPQNDPNIILEVQRVPVGSSSSSSTPPQERSEDI